MSMFFTPVLTALVGHAAWRPGRADAVRSRTREGEGTPERGSARACGCGGSARRILKSTTRSIIEHCYYHA